MTLTAIVLTKNNQNSITRCLRSLSFCDEIIVIDDQSSDNTVLQATKYTSKVFIHPLNNDWASQRNFALTKATSDWLLFLDSDEAISQALKKEILAALNADRYQGFYLYRHDLFLGQSLKYGETANVSLLRLARRGAGVWQRPVHETWHIKGLIGQLNCPLLHLRDLSLNELFLRFNRYTTIDASLQKTPFNLSELIKPFAKFFYNYFFLLGFMDGLAGLHFSLLMSYYSLITRVKHWELSNTK